MASSAGLRQAVGTAAGWLTLACAAALSPLYFHEIQGATRAILGFETSRAPIRAPAPGRSPHSNRIVEIKAGAHGHYVASAEVNGRPIDVLVDSGASIVALTFDDARRAGVIVRGSDYTQRVSTANGFARVAPVVLDRISIGAITVRNVPAAVTEPGSLATSLLGMSFLARLQRVDMRAGTLLLQE
ncbi:MAG TPA: TIGR02281 family clan AA aspartic protease [Hyphomicrobiaceae bacterium]|nr:TIGR02281 family clan AA aspartic protease [Hyphomicrobiaceae bacterium]